MNRRNYLRGTAAAAATALTGALAGCGTLTGNGGGNGERASYDGWVGADAHGDDDTVDAITIDFALLSTLNQEETSSGDGELNDPLGSLPLSYLVGAVFALGFGLSGLGISSLTEEDGPTDRAHLVNNSIVLEGSYDAESVGSSLGASGAQETETYGEFTLYEVGSMGSTSVVAVSEAAVVVASGGENVAEPAAHAKSMIDVDAGDAAMYRDDSSEYDSLVTALPNREIMSVTYDAAGGIFGADAGESSESSGSLGLTTVDDIELSGDAVGVATSAQYSQDELTAGMAIQYASEDAVDSEADVEAALGSEAQDQSVSIDGRLVVVEGTFRNPNADASNA